MKKSTQISLVFFTLALILEIFSAQTRSSDLRLFVGVFIVLGLAFIIYSFKGFVNLHGYLLFKGTNISQNSQIKPKRKEYYLQADTEYLWIQNSIFLDWKDNSKLKQILLGFAAAMGGITSPHKKSKYYLFKLSQDSYSDEKNLIDLLKSNDFKVLDEGKVSKYYSEDTILGMRCSIALGILCILILFAYIVLQII